MAVENLSESVYVGLCNEIGTPQQARYRRDMLDIEEIIMNKVSHDYLIKKMERVLEKGSGFLGQTSILCSGQLTIKLFGTFLSSTTNQNKK